MTPPRPSPPAWLRALGRHDPPPAVRIADSDYTLVQTFKHDFFAATALYEGPAGRIVVKIGRLAAIGVLPALWIGRLLRGHEARLYRLAQGVPGVPRFLGLWGATGLAHQYVEGRPLARSDVPDDEFFPRLAALIEELHRRHIACVDLEKPENILLGCDGRPYLIDFQISWHLPSNRFGDTALARFILGVLQNADRYHLLKHWRRMRPDQLRGPAVRLAAHRPIWIRGHRLFFRPLTLLRRQILVWLGARSSVRVRSPG